MGPGVPITTPPPPLTERRFRGYVLELGRTGDTKTTSMEGFKFGIGVRGTERGSDQGLGARRWGLRDQLLLTLQLVLVKLDLWKKRAGEEG